MPKFPALDIVPGGHPHLIFVQELDTSTSHTWYEKMTKKIRSEYNCYRKYLTNHV